MEDCFDGLGMFCGGEIKYKYVILLFHSPRLFFSADLFVSLMHSLDFFGAIFLFHDCQWHFLFHFELLYFNIIPNYLLPLPFPSLFSSVVSFCLYARPSFYSEVAAHTVSVMSLHL